MFKTAYVTLSATAADLVKSDNPARILQVTDVAVDAAGALILRHFDGTVNIWAPGTWVNVVTDNE